MTSLQLFATVFSIAVALYFCIQVALGFDASRGDDVDLFSLWGKK